MRVPRASARRKSTTRATTGKCQDNEKAGFAIHVAEGIRLARPRDVSKSRRTLISAATERGQCARYRALQQALHALYTQLYFAFVNLLRNFRQILKSAFKISFQNQLLKSARLKPENNNPRSSDSRLVRISIRIESAAKRNLISRASFRPLAI